MKDLLQSHLARALPTLVLSLSALASPSLAWDSKTIEFKSGDELTLTADLYQVSTNKETPFIVLFHQAGWSRGEYLEIAPKLNKLGYNCMAVDARSGKQVNDVPNATVARAQALGLPVDFPDALPDLEASLQFARKHYADGPLIAWGSSYSSALVLKLAGDHPEWVDGVLSFAPGEYFERFGKSADWIRQSAKKIKCPVFITSAKAEQPRWQPIFDVIPKGKKHSYLPTTQGNHGSRALWEKFDDHEGYWKAVEAYLAESFPVAKKKTSEHPHDHPSKKPGK